MPQPMTVRSLGMNTRGSDLAQQQNLGYYLAEGDRNRAIDQSIGSFSPQAFALRAVQNGQGLPSWQQYGAKSANDPAYLEFVGHYNGYQNSMGGGGSGGGSIDGAYNDAKNANLERYNQLIDGYGGLRNRVMGRLENQGNQELDDVKSRYDTQAAAGDQDMVNRGLSGTTVRQTMKLGTQREKGAELRRVNERLQGNLANADERTTGNLMGVVERRNDAYPDANLLAQLAQAYGQSAGGGGSNVGQNMGGYDYVSPTQLGYSMPYMGPANLTGGYGGGNGYSYGNSGGGNGPTAPRAGTATVTPQLSARQRAAQSINPATGRSFAADALARSNRAAAGTRGIDRNLGMTDLLAAYGY